MGDPRIALAEMVLALRRGLTSRGLDPRSHTIVSYGGSGGLFTASLAAAMGVSRVLVPGLASVFSAFGAALADIRRERSQTVSVAVPGPVDLLASVAQDLAADVRSDLAAEGVDSLRCEVSFEVGMRFHRQTSELTIPVATPGWDRTTLARLGDDFLAEYGRRYGQGALLARSGVEIAEVRAIGIADTVKASLTATADADRHSPSHPTRRGICEGPNDIVTEVPVRAWSSLKEAVLMAGPMIVDGQDTTVWIPSNAHAQLGAHNTFVIELDS